MFVVGDGQNRMSLIVVEDRVERARERGEEIDHVGIRASFGGNGDVECRVVSATGDPDAVTSAACENEEERRDRRGRDHAVDDDVVLCASKANERRHIARELLLIEDDYFMDVVG